MASLMLKPLQVQFKTWSVTDFQTVKPHQADPQGRGTADWPEQTTVFRVNVEASPLLKAPT